MNRVAKIADFGHKWGKSLGKWSPYHHPAFLGVSSGIMQLSIIFITQVEQPGFKFWLSFFFLPHSVTNCHLGSAAHT